MHWNGSPSAGAKLRRKTKEKAKAGHVKFFLCLKKLKVRSDVRFADVECINKIFINFAGCWPVFVGKLIFRNMSRQHMFKKIVKNSEYFSWQNISWQHFFQNYILAFPKVFFQAVVIKKINFIFNGGRCVRLANLKIVKG